MDDVLRALDADLPALPAIGVTDADAIDLALLLLGNDETPLGEP